MFKKSSYLLVIFLVFGVLISACGTKDLTKGKTGEQIVEESYKKMVEIKNYDMNLQMNMKMQPPGEEAVNMDIKGKATIFQKPMLMKMNMETSMPGMDQPMNIEQYMEQTENGMIMYQNMGGQWFKMVFEDPAFAEMMSMDPSKNLALYMENLEKAEILGEEKVGEKDTVKIEMVLSSKMYEEIMNQLPMGNITGDMPLDAGIFSKLGEIKATIWVDKLTLDIVKTNMDMTENIQNIGKVMVESGNIPLEAADIFSTMEMSVEYEISNQNKAEQITIPEEAKNAQEMPIGQGSMIP